MKRLRPEGEGSINSSQPQPPTENSVTATQFMQSALKRIRNAFSGNSEKPASSLDDDGFARPLPRTTPASTSDNRQFGGSESFGEPQSKVATFSSFSPETHQSPVDGRPRTALASLRRLKSGKARSFNDLLRRFSAYEDVQRAGFKSTKRDYLELIQYAQRVAANQLSFMSPSSMKGPSAPSTHATRPSSAMSLSSANSNMGFSSSDISMNYSDIQSNNSLIFARSPPAPVVFNEEQQWVKQLRFKIQNLLQLKQNPIEEVQTPVFDRLQKQKQKLSEPQAVKTDNFPPLSEEAIQIIDTSLRKKDGVISSAFNIEISPRDLATLQGRTWLNDEIINFYMNLIMARAQKNPKKYPDLHAFNTFFYPKILKDGYQGVRRWTKKFDLFSKDIVLIPVHLGMHWCCASINFKLKRIEYYDSLHGSNSKIFEVLRSYLHEESLNKRKTGFDLTGWVDFSPKNIPAQENGHDCGVFACTFAEYLSREVAFDFSQAHMKYLRKRMVYEIVTQKLMIE